MGYQWPVRKKPKFNNIKTNGMGSKLEAAVYQILTWREKSGEIKDIQCQSSVTLATEIIIAEITGKECRRPLRWKVDFSFTVVKTGEKVWCEAKGAKGALYKRQLKLWRDGAGPGPLEIWEGDWRRPCLVETVIPKKGA